jgi:membrane protease subunit HflK
MAWNEPGKGDKFASGNSQKSDTPPDLDEVLKNLQQKLKQLFGGNKKPPFSSGNAKRPTESNFFSTKPLFSFIGVIALLVWFFSGLFVVSPAQKAAVLRWGKYTETLEPGLHWIPVLIDSRYLVDVQKVMTFPYSAEMLTQDENIVSVDLVVQYRIGNLKDYLFNVANPTESLQQATASALRQVIGQTMLDDILTSGREKVRQQTQEVLENTLKQYQTGLTITDVNMQPAKPPEEVTAAFDDAIKAREDEQRFKNQAVTYANRIVPTAEGGAARLIAEANAYRQQVVLNAQGATIQFLALLPQYLQAPVVTKERMYLDTLQSVLGNSAKILIDTPQSNNMMYLPLDKLMQKNQATTVPPPLNAMNPPSSNDIQKVAGPVTNPGGVVDTNYPNRPSYDPTQGDKR